MGHVQKPNKLYIWRDQSLFVSSGPIQSHVYKTAFHKLVICIDKDVHIELDNGGIVLTRSYLVKAGTHLPESLSNDDSEKAVFYLSTLSQDYYALASLMSPAVKNVSYGHPNCEQLTRLFVALRDSDYSGECALKAIRPLLIPERLAGKIFVDFDTRIADVIELIERSYAENISISILAKAVCLSASRLEKLFKEQVGIPITTYRIRFRVFLGVIHLCMGASVTEAALASGFSHLAHFSRSFASVNGIQPSAIFAHPAKLETVISNEIMNDSRLQASVESGAEGRLQRNLVQSNFSIQIG